MVSCVCMYIPMRDIHTYDILASRTYTYTYIPMCVRKSSHPRFSHCLQTALGKGWHRPSTLPVVQIVVVAADYQNGSCFSVSRRSSMFFWFFCFRSTISMTLVVTPMEEDERASFLESHRHGHRPTQMTTFQHVF